MTSPTANRKAPLSVTIVFCVSLIGTILGNISIGSLPLDQLRDLADSQAFADVFNSSMALMHYATSSASAMISSTDSTNNDHPTSVERTTYQGKAWIPVHCPTHMSKRNESGSFDPNRDLAESPKKFIKKHPQFWISLHKQNFDRLRWASIMNRGEYYETGITHQFGEILANKTPGLVLDIGMNIGWFTLLARAYGHRVAGFEPNPIMHFRVCESLNLNGWNNDSMIQMFPYGLGVELGTFNLTTGQNPGKSSFYENKLAKRSRRPIPVQVTTLDHVANQEGWLSSTEHSDNGKERSEDTPTIHLMKIDVEGFEPFVLQGGQQLLSSGRVANIILENGNEDTELMIGVLVRLYEAGYRLKLISNTNGQPYKMAKIDSLHEEIKNQIAAGIDVNQTGPEIKQMVKNTFNLWWTKV